MGLLRCREGRDRGLSGPMAEAGMGAIEPEEAMAALAIVPAAIALDGGLQSLQIARAGEMVSGEMVR